MSVASEAIKKEATGCKLSIHWMGTHRAIEDNQVIKAADCFNASPSFLTARKKLFNTYQPAWKKIVKIRNAAYSYWRENTLPWTEEGTRLVKKSSVEKLQSKILIYQVDLQDAVKAFEDGPYQQIVEESKKSLGDLWSQDDYPASLTDQFSISLDFCSIEPPVDLQAISPAVYAQELAKAQAKCEEAAVLAEQAFTIELHALVTHLKERLEAKPDEKKIFRDSAVTNITEFLAKFKALKITSNTELDEVIAKAEALVNPLDPREIRTNFDLKKSLQSQFATISTQLEGMIVKKPRRKVDLGSTTSSSGSDTPVS